MRKQEPKITNANTMKNAFEKLSVLAVVLASCALLCQQARAAQITGAIDFGGLATLNSANLAAATEVTAWPITLAIPSGDFAAYVSFLEAATFKNSWSFNSGPISGFWKVGGFTFDLTASSVYSQSATFLEVTGTGAVSGNGYDSTAGTFTFTTTGPSGSDYFFFSAASASVPDGGLTLSFLGFALMGVEGLRRKLGK